MSVLFAVIPTSEAQWGFGGNQEVGAELLAILRDELNVHRVEFMEGAEHIVTYSAKPVFKSLGKRFGGKTQPVANAIRTLTSDEVSELLSQGWVSILVEGEDVLIRDDDVEIVPTATGGLAIRSEAGYVVALDPTLTPELRLEGLARELVNRVQNLRKESGFQVSDRIRLGIFGDGEILDVAERWGDFVAGEVLAEQVEHGSVVEFERYEASREVDLDGVTGTVAIGRIAGKD